MTPVGTANCGAETDQALALTGKDVGTPDHPLRRRVEAQVRRVAEFWNPTSYNVTTAVASQLRTAEIGRQKVLGALINEYQRAA